MCSRRGQVWRVMSRDCEGMGPTVSDVVGDGDGQEGGLLTQHCYRIGQLLLRQ
jgi:hypothetical protein